MQQSHGSSWGFKTLLPLLPVSLDAQEDLSLQGEVSGWGFNTGLRNVHRGFSPFLQSSKRISTGRSVLEGRGIILISQVGDDLAGFGILFGVGTLISQVEDDLAGFGVSNRKAWSKVVDCVELEK
ncbi:uncharacterized protein EAE97_005023 [Botrytis byssoidea]|uniref:Uncharacterized protein n=1 Tax=Botrytis byssoidea TaxID=139641 RepID=A0A9P5ILN6_9HELO|nr:uncharacterized protein EAE97_005023 [Botrytis byssoidea]KAF7945985.1 hypothetical protein EAE97_005023 [Botrytis byssoidea]